MSIIMHIGCIVSVLFTVLFVSKAFFLHNQVNLNYTGKNISSKDRAVDTIPLLTEAHFTDQEKYVSSPEKPLVYLSDDTLHLYVDPVESAEEYIWRFNDGLQVYSKCNKTSLHMVRTPARKGIVFIRYKSFCSPATDFSFDINTNNESHLEKNEIMSLIL